ncbi:MAG: type II toxin-antitoxin system PrlF family antitoxin [Sphingomonadales bacterium]|nr:type II toxin-antitoxin system PrlF family antitoxin [Sphingomonadales bacterium]
MAHVSRLTSKSQVTVPKDVREALGVGPGEMVEFHVDADGRVTIARVDEERAFEERKADFLRRVQEVRKRFKPLAEFQGMNGLEYQRWIRGEGPEV